MHLLLGVSRIVGLPIGFMVLICQSLPYILYIHNFSPSRFEICLQQIDAPIIRNFASVCALSGDQLDGDTVLVLLTTRGCFLA